MKIINIALTGLALLTIAGTGRAQGDRPTARQDDKNLMRNLGGGLGAAALDAVVRGKVGDALVLGAGAALAGKKYEDARKAQRDENRYDRYDSRDSRDRYDREPSRWERERREQELRERREQEIRDRLRRERIERERREQREREEREEHRRWESQHRGQYWERDQNSRDRDHHH